MSPLDHLIGLVAAAVHDVAHPGKNNVFLTKTMHSLALRYNDQSILENMHIARCFETMRDSPGCNWLGLLPVKFHSPDHEDSPPVNLQHYVRRALIDMVLATDMTKHGKHVVALKSFAANGSLVEGTSPGGAKLDQLENKLFLLKTALHAADISNPLKPRRLMLKWTQMLVEEFWEQGDIERRMDLEVSPLCDRETESKTVPKGQLGFVNFVIYPFWSIVADVVVEAKEALEFLAANKAFWIEKDKEKALADDIFLLGVDDEMEEDSDTIASVVDVDDDASQASPRFDSSDQDAA